MTGSTRRARVRFIALAALIAILSIFSPAAPAQNAVTGEGSPLTSADEINGTYRLYNAGRHSTLREDAYGRLSMGTNPGAPGAEALDYVMTVTPDGNGLFTIATRRGRYIPEVALSREPLTVGHADRAGHFRITPAGAGLFTIVNSADPRYGFDADGKGGFVGWNAGEGENCFFALIPVTTGTGGYPLDTYNEPADPAAAMPGGEWDALPADSLLVSWVNKDDQFARHELPAVRIATDTTLTLWRGERAAVKALVFSSGSFDGLTLGIEGADGSNITADPRWLRYVITDSHNACGNHSFSLPTWTTADVVDLSATAASVDARSVRPVWLTVEAPRTAAPGLYTLTLTVTGPDGTPAAEPLDLDVRVADKTLPAPADYAFWLDLWQHPDAVARYYGVEPWSDAHFEAMRPYMQALGRAGQKVVSAIMFHEPWGDQSHDKFSPMVETYRLADGTWRFDFTVFDRWVEFMEECGIDKRINCFSMIPWDMTFRYIDEPTDTYRFLKTTTSSAEYRDLWTALLKSFTDHVRAKGWLEKTAIAMDERSLGQMLDAISLVREVAPELKVSLAGNYHKELVDLVDDYCLAYAQRFSSRELRSRRAKGMVSTVYTCCTEAHPNTFTNSPIAEAAYLPVQAIASGADGYLRWAFANWHETPLTDSRFRLFGSGDTFMMYPGPRSSVRFERLAEGVQLAEKMAMMKKEWNAAADGEKVRALAAIQERLASRATSYYDTPARMVAELTALVNGDEPAASGPATDYCPAALAPSGSDKAATTRYVAEASTSGCLADLRYKATGPSKGGYVMVPDTIRVVPGSQFTLSLTANPDPDGLRYCRMAVAADWNRDYQFDTLGEEIARLGDKAQANDAVADAVIAVAVPADAVSGLSRLRVTYADAWADAPDMCGELRKGFAFDIPMEIADPSQTGIATVGAPTQRTVMLGDTLYAPAEVTVSVLGIDGRLIHRAERVRSYTLARFTPAVFNILIDYPDGRRETFRLTGGC